MKINHILKKQSFGNQTVRIDDFFSDEKLYTHSEMIKFVDFKINEIIQDGKRILQFNYPTKHIRHFFMEFFKIKDADVQLAVARELKVAWKIERDNFFFDLIEQEKKRVKELVIKKRNEIKRLPRNKKIELLRSLEAKGEIDIQDNATLELFIKNIHLFIDKI